MKDPISSQKPSANLAKLKSLADSRMHNSTLEQANTKINRAATAVDYPVYGVFGLLFGYICFLWSRKTFSAPSSNKDHTVYKIYLASSVAAGAIAFILLFLEPRYSRGDSVAVLSGMTLSALAIMALINLAKLIIPSMQFNSYHRWMAAVINVFMIYCSLRYSLGGYISGDEILIMGLIHIGVLFGFYVSTKNMAMFRFFAAFTFITNPILIILCFCYTAPIVTLLVLEIYAQIFYQKSKDHCELSSK